MLQMLSTLYISHGTTNVKVGEVSNQCFCTINNLSLSSFSHHVVYAVIIQCDNYNSIPGIHQKGVLMRAELF